MLSDDLRWPLWKGSLNPKEITGPGGEEVGMLILPFCVSLSSWTPWDKRLSLYHLLLSMVLCLASSPKQQAQMIMGWNHEAIKPVLPLRCISGVWSWRQLTNTAPFSHIQTALSNPTLWFPFVLMEYYRSFQVVLLNSLAKGKQKIKLNMWGRLHSRPFW